MKILSAEKIREADAYTIKHEPIKSIDLMERAGSLCFDWIYHSAPKLFPSSITEEKDWIFYVVCGLGNNGGDGLVIARQLQRNGYNVELVTVAIRDKPSKDYAANFEKLGKTKKSAREIKKTADIFDFPDDAVIIDAIFGTGLSRPTEGIAKEVIQKINKSRSTVVSVDMPSGLFSGDNADNDFSGIVKADYILTFQTPKLAFFLAENTGLVGEVHILDIGIHPQFLEEVEVPHSLLTAHEVKLMRRPRPSHSHKGSFGHALIIAGSKGKWGAAVMATKACLRSGAGLVSALVASEGATFIHNALPEAMLADTTAKSCFSELPDLKPYSAIGVGPGLGKADETVRALKLLIQEAKVPMVFDADALNIIADNPTWLAFIPKGSVLTPHPGEFARLIGEKLSHSASMDKQMELSKKYGIYILLKGAASSLSLPDGKIIINSTGNPGMATGGTGDVLTGILTGLLASGYSGLEAAAMAMYLHGKAGDLALADESVESLVAMDIVRFLGKAFQSLDHEA